VKFAQKRKLLIGIDGVVKNMMSLNNHHKIFAPDSNRNSAKIFTVNPRNEVFGPRSRKRFHSKRKTKDSALYIKESFPPHPTIYVFLGFSLFSLFS
jgi:hypothetical protein